MAFEKNDDYKKLSFKQLGEFKAQQTEELKSVFDKHTDSGDGQLRMTEDALKEVRERNEFLGEVTKQWEALREADSIFQKTREELRKAEQEPPAVGIEDLELVPGQFLDAENPAFRTVLDVRFAGIFGGAPLGSVEKREGLAAEVSDGPQFPAVLRRHLHAGHHRRALGEGP
jgi:hypothetical protein